MVFSTSLRKQKEIKTDIYSFLPGSLISVLEPHSQPSLTNILQQGQVLDFCDTWNKGVMPVFVRQSLFATFSRRSSATSRWPEQIKAHTLAQASCWSQRLQYTSFLFQIDKVTVCNNYLWRSTFPTGHKERTLTIVIRKFHICTMHK